jgi:tetratricopeptide (TPR) repeat protein
MVLVRRSAVRHPGESMRTAPFALAFIAASSIGLSAVNSGSPAPASMSSPATPEAMAADAFNSGVKHLNAGDKAEQKPDAKKSLDEYSKALKDFGKAVKLDPKNHRAFNGLGYAYRKTGDYNKALESYATALQLSPDFPDAIEYRGEAYLGLNRPEDAKQAYLTLFASSRTHAALLLKAMKVWVDQRRVNPAGVDPAAVAAFDGWLHERAALADHTADMARNSPPVSWR